MVTVLVRHMALICEGCCKSFITSVFCGHFFAGQFGIGREDAGMLPKAASSVSLHSTTTTEIQLLSLPCVSAASLDLSHCFTLKSEQNSGVLVMVRHEGGCWLPAPPCLIKA